MRLIKRGLYIFCGLVLLALGVLVVDGWIEQTRVQQFYASRPMLRAMEDALPRSDKTGTDLKPIFFSRVPMSSSRGEVLASLKEEGVVCSASPADRQRGMVCHAPQSPMNVARWHIEIRFDEEDRLLDARVLALKGTL